jgi:hypothetical protein
MNKNIRYFITKVGDDDETCAEQAQESNARSHQHLQDLSSKTDNGAYYHDNEGQINHIFTGLSNSSPSYCEELQSLDWVNSQITSDEESPPNFAQEMEEREEATDELASILAESSSCPTIVPSGKHSIFNCLS